MVADSGALMPLAAGREFHPWIGAAHLQGALVVEDVVAELVQWRLRIGGGKLGRVLNLLAYLHVNHLRKGRTVTDWEFIF